MVEYRVRTKPGHVGTAGVLLAAAMFVDVAALGSLSRLPVDLASGATIVLLLGLVSALPLGYWFGSAHLRVGAGRHLIRFYPDRVEVPHASRRQPIAFARAGLVLTIRDIGVAISGSRLGRGKLIVLRNGPARRELSTLVVEDPRDVAPLLADLRAFAAGEPPLGRAAREAATVRTAYDDRLDRELAELAELDAS